MLVVIKTILENIQCHSMKELSSTLKIPKSNTDYHLHQLVYVGHFGECSLEIRIKHMEFSTISSFLMQTSMIK